MYPCDDGYDTADICRSGNKCKASDYNRNGKATIGARGYCAACTFAEQYSAVCEGVSRLDTNELAWQHALACELLDEVVAMGAALIEAKWKRENRRPAFSVPERITEMPREPRVVGGAK